MAVKENMLTTTKENEILEIDTYPFKGLNISEDWRKLETVEERALCSLCKKSRKYFCYTCYAAVPEIQHFVPKIKLPIKIDIIKHAREMDGKSTAVHAAVLAPEDVRIFTYPCIPDYSPEENVVLIFPNKDAVSVEEVCETFFSKSQEPARKRLCLQCNFVVIHRAVFIDSTWNQSRGIFKDPRIKNLPSVVLKTRLSQFWRHQADSPRWYLATIEAIHQFLLELDAVQWRLSSRTALCVNSISATNSTSNSDSSSKCIQSDTTSSTEEKVDEKGLVEHSDKETDKASTAPTLDKDLGDKKSFCNQQEYCYNGQYDNILFFFRFMYSKIHTLYDHEQLRSYKRRLQ